MSTPIKEKPIIFSAGMIRAILDGRKSQTRRVLKPQPQRGFDPRRIPEGYLRSPYRPGDRLWVRETYCGDHINGVFAYRASWTEKEQRNYVSTPGWRPSIYMPRWASRITPEVTGVRVERVQEISEMDALAEGFEPIEAGQLTSNTNGARHAFRLYWDSLNAKRGFGWDVNPWVWVIEFARVRKQHNSG